MMQLSKGHVVENSFAMFSKWILHLGLKFSCSGSLLSVGWMVLVLFRDMGNINFSAKYFQLYLFGTCIRDMGNINFSTKYFQLYLFSQ
jgi:hypothetical protein